MRFVDAHDHLVDPRWGDSISKIISDSNLLGIDFFMQGGVGPEDWDRQEKLKALYPHQIGMSFGLHPWFVARSSEKECDQAMDLLAIECHKAQALGEMGLDLRPAFIQDDGRERQIDYFRMQLELAQVVKKPCILHLVKAVEESLRILQWTGLSEAKGMVHAFNGSQEVMQAYLKEGLYISIGTAILKEKNQKLRKSIEQLPLDRFLLESDAPDQAPSSDGVSGELNLPKSIFGVAEQMAAIKKVKTQEILEKATENFKILFSIN